jgi:predicted nucleotidyltransferase
MAESTLQIPARHLEELRRLIAAHLPEEEVWAYGSRVSGTAHETSDLDLVVRHPSDLNSRQSAALWRLKGAISESNLPLLVDLFDWAGLPPAFRENIAGQHIVLHSPEHPACRR